MPGADEWLAAFWDLHTDRQIGMAAGPIPGAAIDRWVAMGRVHPAEADHFRRCMRACDEAWREAAEIARDEAKVAEG